MKTNERWSHMTEYMANDTLAIPSLIPRLSSPSDFDDLQYGKMEGRPGRSCHMLMWCKDNRHMGAVPDKESQGNVLSKISRPQRLKDSITHCLVDSRLINAKFWVTMIRHCPVRLPSVYLTSSHVTRSPRPSPLFFLPQFWLIFLLSRPYPVDWRPSVSVGRMGSTRV